MYSWKTSLDSLADHRGVIVVLGPTDTGKTTWVAELVRRSDLEEIIIVSGDPGQVTFGAPGLLSAARWDPAVESLADLQPDRCYFIGKSTPSGRFLQMIHGLTILTKWARNRAGLVIVDTDGYVSGGAAREYKRLLLSHLSPCDAILLGDDPVLDPIHHWAKSQNTIETHTVKPPIGAETKTMADRNRYRKKMMNTWFQNAEVRTVPLEEHRIYSQVSGVGRLLSDQELSEISDLLHTRVLHAERTKQWLNVVLAEYTPYRNVRALRQRFSDLKVKVMHASDWKDVLTADMQSDGFSSGMGYIAGWHKEPRSLLIRGRFFRDPGDTWFLGDFTYQEG